MSGSVPMDHQTNLPMQKHKMALILCTLILVWSGLVVILTGGFTPWKQVSHTNTLQTNIYAAVIAGGLQTQFHPLSMADL